MAELTRMGMGIGAAATCPAARKRAKAPKTMERTENMSKDVDVWATEGLGEYSQRTMENVGSTVRGRAHSGLKVQ